MFEPHELLDEWFHMWSSVEKCMIRELDSIDEGGVGFGQCFGKAINMGFDSGDNQGKGVVSKTTIEVERPRQLM